jgi:AcrR family transcriptional regulator
MLQGAIGGVTGAMTRVARRKERTRRVLMEVGLALFYEKGIYWTKIEDITERADVGKGTFYQYFDTKEDLLAVLLKQGLDDLLAQAKESTAGVRPGLATLHKIVEIRLQFFLNHPEYLLLLHQIRGLLQLKTQARRRLRDIYSAHIDQLGEVLLPALNGKKKRGRSARELATALAAYTSGLLTYHLVLDEGNEGRPRGGKLAAQIQESLTALL